MRRDSPARTSSRALVHLSHDVEPVEDVQSLGAFFADDLQVRLPHVGADENDLRGDFFTDDGENSLERFGGSFLPDPEQACDPKIDLVSQCQVFVTSGVLDLVHTDGVDLAGHPVLQTPGDHVFDRVEDFVPGSTKRFGS